MVPARFFLYLVVLTPLIVLSVVSAIGLERGIHHVGGALDAQRKVWAQVATSRVQDRLHHMDRATLALSRSPDIVAAIETADNGVLSSWGLSFVQDFDTLAFADTAGLVLARMPDEFRFGNRLQAMALAQAALAEGQKSGIHTIEGKESLSYCRAIRKYDDLPVGVICIAQHVTPKMLARLMPGTSFSLGLLAPDGTLIAGENQADVHHRMRLGIMLDGYDFELAFQDNAGYSHLMSLKRWLYASDAIAIIGMLIALALFIRWTFHPYTRLINSIVDYSAERCDLATLRERLDGLRRRPSQEIARVATALVDMIDVIRDNLLRTEESNARLRDLATKDPLTQLANRRALDETLAAEIRRSCRYVAPLSVVMLDIDHFKVINDTHGHATGDDVLRRLSAVIAEHSRSTDVAGRWGGEEFLILCPGIELAAASVYAEKLRALIENTDFSQGLRVTASAGLAEYLPGEAAAELIARADKALYDAKAAGRNRVMMLAA